MVGWGGSGGGGGKVHAYMFIKTNDPWTVKLQTSKLLTTHTRKMKPRSSRVGTFLLPNEADVDQRTHRAIATSGSV